MTVSGRCRVWGDFRWRLPRSRSIARDDAAPRQRDRGYADATNTKGSGYFFLLGEIVTLLSVGMPDFFNIDWTFFAVAAGLGFFAIWRVPAVG